MGGSPSPVYRQHLPHPALAGSVECLWTIRSEGAVVRPVPNRVVPDGAIDIVFNLGDDPLSTDMPRHAMRAFVVGTMTRALEVRHVGRVDVLGVRFRPGAAPRLLGVAAGELTDRAVSLDEIARRLGSAARPVLEGKGPAAAAALMDVLLELDRRAPPEGMRERLAAVAWARLRSTRGSIRMHALASELGAGERRLQRAFRERVGLTPKQAARVARLNAVIEILRRHPDRPLGRIALQAGYYDQPHFNREFARLAGIAPERWREEQEVSVRIQDLEAPDE